MKETKKVFFTFHFSSDQVVIWHSGQKSLKAKLKFPWKCSDILSFDKLTCKTCLLIMWKCPFLSREQSCKAFWSLEKHAFLPITWNSISWPFPKKRGEVGIRGLGDPWLLYYFFLNIIFFNLTSQYYKCVKLFLSLLSERREMGDPIKPSGCRWESNPGPLAPESCVLPMHYSTSTFISSTYFFLKKGAWSGGPINFMTLPLFFLNVAIKFLLFSKCGH